MLRQERQIAAAAAAAAATERRRVKTIQMRMTRSAWKFVRLQ